MEDGSRVTIAIVNRIPIASADHIREFDSRIDSPLRKHYVNFTHSLQHSPLFSHILLSSYEHLSEHAMGV